MSPDPLPAFRSWRDRVTYLLAEGQLVVAAVIVTVGVLLVWTRPTLPAVPSWVWSVLAAFLILGPPLWIAGLQIVDWLRVRNWVTVHHINAVEDEREKYRVPPELWAEKTVDGPPPYPVNDGAAWEVREFEYCEDEGVLRVSGTWLSATADSKLITSKAMLEDVHGELIGGYLELARLRGRVERMGVEIQEATVMELTEATERATMLDDTAVKTAFEDARADADVHDIDELPEIDDYGEVGADLVEDRPAQQTATECGASEP